MDSIAVIDLGEARGVVQESRPLRAPRRTPLAVLVALASLLLLGAAAPVRPALVPLFEVPVGGPAQLDLGGGLLYVNQRGNDPSVSAYRVPGGTRRWYTRITPAPEGIGYLPAAKVLIATSYDTVSGLPSMTVLDAVTGAVLWERAGYLRWYGPGDTGALIMMPPAHQEVLGQPSDEPTVTSWVDLRTGRVIWSRSAAADVQYIAIGQVPVAGLPRAAGAGRLLLVNTTGAIQVLDQHTGAELASRQLADQRPDPEQQGDVAVGVGDGQLVQIIAEVVGDQLYVGRPGRFLGGGELTAYDVATLSTRWRIPQTFGGYPTDCGALVCLMGNDSLTAVDPATGAVRWRSARWSLAGPLGADRLLGSAPGSQAPIAVLDAGTGRMLLDLTGWNVVGGQVSAGTLLAKFDRVDPVRAWFATLSPGRPALRLLGPLARIDMQTCQLAGDLLTCETADNMVGVWRYPA